MYIRVGIVPTDTEFHFFFVSGKHSMKRQQYMSFNRLDFGVTASPYLADSVSQYNAHLHEIEYVLFETVLKSSDDSLDSLPNVEKQFSYMNSLHTFGKNKNDGKKVDIQLKTCT